VLSKSSQKGEMQFGSALNCRLDSPVKRDAYGEVLAKHNELVKRGETPGSGHLLSKRHKIDSSSSGSDSEDGASTPTSILFGDTPTVTPAVAVDQDGQDISCHTLGLDLICSILFGDPTRK
jgi:hypothetical protein